jgi:hypothetical protein
VDEFGSVAAGFRSHPLWVDRTHRNRSRLEIFMNKISRYGFAVLLAAGAGIGLTPSSEARSVSAFLGQPQNPANYSCFGNGNGGVINTCAGAARRFCVALPIDAASSTVTVTVQGSIPGTNTVGCQAYSVTRAAVGYANGPYVSSALVTPVPLSLGTLGVPAAGGLYACCDLAQNAKMLSVNW